MAELFDQTLEAFDGVNLELLSTIHAQCVAPDVRINLYAETLAVLMAPVFLLAWAFLIVLVMVFLRLKLGCRRPSKAKPLSARRNEHKGRRQSATADVLAEVSEAGMDRHQ